MGFMRLGPDFSRFGFKDMFSRVRKRMLDNIVFRQSHAVGFFLTFFLQHVSFTLFNLCPAGFSKVPWWYFKESYFRKDMYYLV